MKVYTKTGDKGQTSLVGGTRVPKTHVRIEAYGTVDELNSWIGALRDQPACAAQMEDLIKIQDRLFVIGSNLALEKPGKFNIPVLEEEDVLFMENWIDEMEKSLEPMRNFILPGGHIAVSTCHISRTVCRRAERQVIRMAEEIDVDEKIIRFLNRLSDLLFVYSRKLACETGAEQIPWLPKKH